MEFGLDYMSKKYSHFVVLEDDVVPYKNFFKFISLNLKNLKIMIKLVVFVDTSSKR